MHVPRHEIEPGVPPLSTWPADGIVGTIGSGPSAAINLGGPASDCLVGQHDVSFAISGCCFGVFDRGTLLWPPVLALDAGTLVRGSGPAKGKERTVRQREAVPAGKERDVGSARKRVGLFGMGLPKR